MVIRKRKPYNSKRTRMKFYQIGSDLFLYQAYNQGSTLRDCPRELHPFLQQEDPIAQTSYKGSKRGWITTYLLKCARRDLQITLNRIGRSSEIRDGVNLYLNGEVDAGYNIFSTHVDLGDLTDFFIQAMRHDIVEFCHEKPAAEGEELPMHFKLVDRIKPNPSFSLVEPKRHDVVKEGKGRFYTDCIIDIGLNPSLGCVSNTTPRGTYDPSGRCSYCYAYQNGPSFLETLLKFDGEDLLERINTKIEELGLVKRETLFFRVGQTVEANVPSYMKNYPGFQDKLGIILRTLSKIGKERDIRVAMPTKVLEFDEGLAKLLIDANVSLLASIAYESLEPGIVAHGFTVEKRLEEILQFARAGVNANLYVATDITRSPEKMQDDAKRAVAFFKEHGELGLQFLDMRITGKHSAEVIGGGHWQDLQFSEQGRLFFEGNGRWGKTSQNYLHALFTHPDWLELVGDNTGDVRLCSTHCVEEERRCGKCFMDRSV